MCLGGAPFGEWARAADGGVYPVAASGGVLLWEDEGRFSAASSVCEVWDAAGGVSLTTGPSVPELGDIVLAWCGDPLDRSRPEFLGVPGMYEFECVGGWYEGFTGWNHELGIVARIVWRFGRWEAGFVEWAARVW